MLVRFQTIKVSSKNNGDRTKTRILTVVLYHQSISIFHFMDVDVAKFLTFYAVFALRAKCLVESQLVGTILLLGNVTSLKPFT